MERLSVAARVAVVDDEPRMGQVLAMILRRAGHEVSVFTEPQALLDDLEALAPDLVLTDLKMPGMDGVALLAALGERAPEVPVIVLTAHGTVSAATEAMRLGAYDFIEKPIDRATCEAAVRRALELTRLTRENRYLRAEVRQRHALDDLIIASDAMREVFALAERAARSRATVLILGESGTGKELVARAIHYHSSRVGGPRVAVNCKALATGVLESELFGHVKGAFTGAERARAGMFERADGGTLFLDEVGELGADAQAKLLRVLQEREVQRVGGDQPIAVDVRLVAATNRDLAAEVRAGTFREDLYFRLAVIPIHLPPLRARPEDILPLARHFLRRWAEELGRPLTGWTDEAERALLAHPWPGNVRELEHAIERAAVLARDPTRIDVDDLMLGRATTLPAPGLGAARTLHEALDDAAAAQITAALARTQGRRAEAADLLGVDRSTLYRFMRRLGLLDDEP